MSEKEIREQQAKRLIRAREMAGYDTAVDAARAMRARGIIRADSTYLGHENNSRGMQRSVAVGYCKFFKVRPAWLLTGDGSPKSTSAEAENEETEFVVPPDVSELPERDIKAGASYAGGLDGGGEFNADDINAHKPIATWSLPTSYVRDGLGVQPGQGDIVTIEGNSMDDGSRNSLASGDKAILDLRSQNYRQGGIYALWDGETVIVKQVEYVRGTEPPQIICKSLNTAYDPFKIVLDGNAHIIGRVAGKIMRM